MNNKEELDQIDENKLEEVYNNTFYYKLHDQYPVSKSQWCKSFAFNKDGTRLAINYNQIIKVYELKKGDLKYLQSIFGHSFDVNCLKWLNNNNQIISCGHDTKIVFWPINLTSNSKFILKLVMHQQPISCLIINSLEDLLISSSIDQTIQFFELNHQNNVWKCSQVLQEHYDTIFSLSLSQNENQLITCGYDNLILILQNSSQSSLKKGWIVKQKIFTDVYGYRLCFLTDYLFTFQPYNKEEMWIYDNRNSLDQFIKTKSVHVKSDGEGFASLFPHQFIPSKGILLAKNGNFIHLIKIQNSNDFQIQQSINYRDQCIFGQLSNDGDLLVTWDCKSNLIKVRKLVEQ